MTSVGVGEPTDYQNYLQLQILLVETVLPILRVQFIEEWERVTRKRWENNRTSGQQLTTLIDEFPEDVSHITSTQRFKLKGGDVKAWDLSLVIWCLKLLMKKDNTTMPNQNIPPTAPASRYLQSLDAVLKIRNDLSHPSCLVITNRQFLKNKTDINTLINCDALTFAYATFKQTQNANGNINHQNQRRWNGNHHQRPGIPQMEPYYEPPPPQGFWESLFSCFR